MANELRTRDGLPFNFVDGLRIKGVDVTNWDKVFIDQGASYVGFTPVGNLAASNVQAAIAELESEKQSKTEPITTAINLRPGANQGVVWDIDAFGGGGDSASITLETAGGEAAKMRFKMTNDLDDNFEFTAKSGDGLTAYNNAMTLNGNVLLNAANYVNYAAPMISDYTALRAYTGNASQVRITSNGLAGFFYYDATDTTSTDNGGTVIVAGNGKRWKRLFDGVVSVLWFMSPDQIADVKANLTTIDTTSSIQLAINYLISIKTSGNNGIGTLYFPKGKYLVNGTLSLTNVYGLAIRGDGMYATAIVKKTDSGNLFSLQTYGRVDVRDIFFSHETSTSYATWTNVLFNLDGSSGGNHFSLENVETLGFGIVVKYNANSLNEDTNFFRKIRCSNFKTFLYARSSQAIINSIRDSTLFGACTNVFDISGFGHLHVDTCNVVVSGRVFDLSSGQVGPQSNYVVTNTKFEYWPQGGNVGTTQLIVMNADMSARFFFYGGGLAGGAPDPSVKQLVIRGTLSQIVFEGGTWDNRICIENYDSVGATVFGSYVHPNCFVKFKECVNSPSPANVAYNNAGVGVSYMGIVWEACQDRPNLCLTGLSNGQTYNSSVPSESLVNRATFTGANTGGNIMNGATATTFPYPHYGQPAILSRVRVIIHSSGAFVSGTIKMFSDSAKTVQIGTTQVIPNGAISAPVVYDLTIPNNALITEGVWVEITNTNGIYAYGRVFIETISI